LQVLIQINKSYKTYKSIVWFPFLKVNRPNLISIKFEKELQGQTKDEKPTETDSKTETKEETKTDSKGDEVDIDLNDPEVESNLHI
jgi:hypothetical protein